MPRRSHLTPLLLSLLGCLMACQEPVLTQGQQDLTNRPPSPATSAITQPDTGSPTQASLGGLIRERDSGKLVSGATVRLDTRATSSDQAGFYQFLNPGSGEAKLIVIHPDYAPFTETLSLDGKRRIHDVQLSLTGAPAASPTPQLSSSPGVTPSASPTPLILLPDGSVATPAPTASPSPSASSSSSPQSSGSPSASATPVASASPAWDPRLDEAAQAEVLVKRRSNGLELTFLLAKINGIPVNWEWGQIKVEYYIGKVGAPAADSLVTSGRSVINAFGDSFVVTTGQAQVPETVRVKFTLTLPDARIIENEMIVQVSG